MTSWAQLVFQDGASPIIEEFIYFHDFAMVILVFIITYVGLIMGIIIYGKFLDKRLLERQNLEALWTILPALVLVQIAAPSLLLLYTLDSLIESPYLTLKVIGHQWYWSYDYYFSGFDRGLEVSPYLKFDSYIVSSGGENSFRLLDVDNRVIVPYREEVQVLITSGDVLHSWAVPRLGVKADSCPGRLNQLRFVRHRPGLYYGQCSEICGANHSFMPICLERVRRKDFESWYIYSSVVNMLER